MGLWIAPSLLHLVIGFAMALVVLPLTRIYEPLERTTGFSFGYAAGYGILGGISPIVVTAFKARLPPHLKAIAPAICERRGVLHPRVTLSPRSEPARAGRAPRGLARAALTASHAPLIVPLYLTAAPTSCSHTSPGLSILSAGSYLGIVLLRLYLPRLDKPYVGRIR